MVKDSFTTSARAIFGLRGVSSFNLKCVSLICLTSGLRLLTGTVLGAGSGRSALLEQRGETALFGLRLDLPFRHRPSPLRLSSPLSQQGPGLLSLISGSNIISARARHASAASLISASLILTFTLASLWPEAAGLELNSKPNRI